MVSTVAIQASLVSVAILIYAVSVRDRIPRPVVTILVELLRLQMQSRCIHDHLLIDDYFLQH